MLQIASSVFLYFLKLFLFIAHCTGAMTCALATLPLEIMFEIVSFLPAKARVTVSGTCRHLQHVIRSSLLSDCARALAPFNLLVTYLRFMQAATGCIVGGTFVSNILFAGTIPAPPTLDIFCPRGLATELLRFLANCDPCALASPVAPGNRNLIRAGWCISSPKLVDRRIYVYEAVSLNPMRAIAQSPTTAHFAAWTLNGIWHGYPTATSAGIFLSSPKRLFLDTERNKMFASSLLRFLVAKGLKFSPSWMKPHLCARHPACPSTYRTSQDDGCLLIRFPSSFPVAGADDAQHHHKESVGWILGEWRCEVNLVESVSGDLPVITATYDTGVRPVYH